MAGAPSGNQNAAKAHVWSEAIRRALDHRSRVKQKEALDDLAEKLLEKCEAGDMAALKELGDRLDGKAGQSVTVGGDLNNPLVVSGTMTFVHAATASNPGDTRGA